MYPEDYVLFELGNYDKVTGAITGYYEPVRISSLPETKVSIVNSADSKDV